MEIELLKFKGQKWNLPPGLDFRDENNILTYHLLRSFTLTYNIFQMQNQSLTNYHNATHIHLAFFSPPIFFYLFPEG